MSGQQGSVISNQWLTNGEVGGYWLLAIGYWLFRSGRRPSGRCSDDQAGG